LRSRAGEGFDVEGAEAEEEVEAAYEQEGSATQREGKGEQTFSRGLVKGSGSVGEEEEEREDQWHSIPQLTSRSMEMFQEMCHRGKIPGYESCRRRG
jgi:hypothetical protein